MLVWIITLTVVFSGIILVISVFGKTVPPPAFAKWFTNADGSPCPMPCLFGIRLGVTKWDDVEGILKAHPLLSDLQSGESYRGQGEEISQTYYLPTQAMYITVRQYDDTVAMFISIGADADANLNFRQALLVLGYPQNVSLSLYNNNQLTAFTYWNEMLLLSIYV